MQNPSDQRLLFTSLIRFYLGFITTFMPGRWHLPILLRHHFSYGSYLRCLCCCCCYSIVFYDFFTRTSRRPSSSFCWASIRFRFVSSLLRLIYRFQASVKIPLSKRLFSLSMAMLPIHSILASSVSIQVSLWKCCPLRTSTVTVTSSAISTNISYSPLPFRINSFFLQTNHAYYYVVFYSLETANRFRTTTVSSTMVSSAIRLHPSMKAKKRLRRVVVQVSKSCP